MFAHVPIDSIAYAYMTMTAALGFIPLRHEGKLTGLAARGQPIFADKIAARFSVNESGRISSDFRDYPEMVKFIYALAKGVSRDDASASIQQVLENVMLRSIARLLEQNEARHLGLAGGVFANVRLNRLRPQIIEREENALYYDILTAFEGETGLPVLVNMSFNVHEEPIVNKPSGCIRALLDCCDHARDLRENFRAR